MNLEPRYDMTLREARAKATEPLQFGDPSQIKAVQMVYFASELKGLGVDEVSCWGCGCEQGTVECTDCDGDGRYGEHCSFCKGTGFVNCIECHGTGHISIERLDLQDLRQALEVNR